MSEQHEVRFNVVDGAVTGLRVGVRSPSKTTVAGVVATATAAVELPVRRPSDRLVKEALALTQHALSEGVAERKQEEKERAAAEEKARKARTASEQQKRQHIADLERQLAEAKAQVAS